MRKRTSSPVSEGPMSLRCRTVESSKSLDSSQSPCFWIYRLCPTTTSQQPPIIVVRFQAVQSDSIILEDIRGYKTVQKYNTTF
jgi:hypothetical protein